MTAPDYASEFESPLLPDGIRAKYWMGPRDYVTVRLWSRWDSEGYGPYIQNSDPYGRRDVALEKALKAWVQRYGPGVWDGNNWVSVADIVLRRNL